jgi:cytochrome oxidase assembly protein ShyY1
VTLFVVLFLPVLLRLGFWQLDRAEEKRDLLAVYQQQRELPAIQLDNFSDHGKMQYRKVVVEGRYDAQRYWLLDNRSREGLAGYEVIMPLILENSQGLQQQLLINRGWVKALSRRDQLPIIETPTEKVTVSGYFHMPPANAVIKHSHSDLHVEWPKRVLSLDIKSAKQALDSDVYPLLLRLDDTATGALITEWSVINTRPEKHHGYAVQWFSMSAALLALYAWCLFREKIVN